MISCTRDPNSSLSTFCPLTPLKASKNTRQSITPTSSCTCKKANEEINLPHIFMPLQDSKHNEESISLHPLPCLRKQSMPHPSPMGARYATPPTHASQMCHTSELLPSQPLPSVVNDHLDHSGISSDDVIELEHLSSKKGTFTKSKGLSNTSVISSLTLSLPQVRSQRAVQGDRVLDCSERS